MKGAEAFGGNVQFGIFGKRHGIRRADGEHTAAASASVPILAERSFRKVYGAMDAAGSEFGMGSAPVGGTPLLFSKRCDSIEFTFQGWKTL